MADRFARSTALIAFCATTAFPVAAQMIVTDGRTRTHLLTTENVTDVTTTTVHGNNAFNSFRRFNVDEGRIVNLHLPDATENLLNIVSGEATQINGMLNSIRDGAIDGNVYFANPHGFVLGTNGVINVGALSLTTPPQSFVDTFFDDIDTHAATLRGQSAPIGDGQIQIGGRIASAGDISLKASGLDLGGTLASSGIFTTGDPAFQDFVNTRGLVAATVARATGGDIVLQASGDVLIGADAWLGSAGGGARAGNITIRGGRDVVVGSGVVLAARDTSSSDPGGKLTIDAGRRFEASTNLQPAAGSYDIRAREGLTIPFDLSAPNGGVHVATDGNLEVLRNVTVAPRPGNEDSAHLSAGGDLTVRGDVQGGSINLDAGRSINVTGDLSTRSDGVPVIDTLDLSAVTIDARGSVDLRSTTQHCGGASGILNHGDESHPVGSHVYFANPHGTIVSTNGAARFDVHGTIEVVQANAVATSPATTRSGGLTNCGGNVALTDLTLANLVQRFCSTADGSCARDTIGRVSSLLERFPSLTEDLAIAAVALSIDSSGWLTNNAPRFSDLDLQVRRTEAMLARKPRAFRSKLPAPADTVDSISVPADFQDLVRLPDLTGTVAMKAIPDLSVTH